MKRPFERTSMWPSIILFSAALLSGNLSAEEKEEDDHANVHSYYKSVPQFHPWPDPDAPSYPLLRFGPVGIALDLRRPNFTIHVTSVEPGSPAETCGKLKAGQIIESINGEVLKDIDPRVQLGNMITKAEANGGIMKMMVKDSAEGKASEVTVKIPALGAYSDTWPMKCKKSDAIVRQYADLLANKIEHITVANGSAYLLFMLSTGEEKDLNVARGWIKDLVASYKGKGLYPWWVGYSGPALCEYYLRTGDKSIIPIIEQLADYLKGTMYNNGWMGRGGAQYSYGHMNAAGVHCVTFLIMAKECGAKVDEQTLQSALRQFYRFAGHGTVPYGNKVPEKGMVDNGRDTGLAIAMAAAANLHPKGEESAYAKARDINATKGFYSTSWLFHGHTGGGIGEFWRGQSMGLVKDKRPQQYRSFMDGRRWMYDLSRTHDGNFGWFSKPGVSYIGLASTGGRFGGWIPMIYTLPRKHLRIYGAPRTKYSKTHTIPDRPWGTAADEIFYSLTPGEYKPGERQDISKEMLVTDASKPIFARLGNPEVSDDVLVMYANHINQGIRSGSARAILKHQRYHLVLPLLKSKDPRARLAGITCITGPRKTEPLPAEELTDEMFKEITTMINDPEEAWWVVMGAMEALRRARPELIAPHVKRLTYWLEHDDHWLRNAAIAALSPVLGDDRFYKDILIRAGNIYSSGISGKLDLGTIAGSFKNASPKAQQFAIKVLSDTYTKFPQKMIAPGGKDISNNLSNVLNRIGDAMVTIPGGYDELHRIGPSRFPNQVLPHKDIFLKADASKFGPELKKTFVPLILNELIPAYVKEKGEVLKAELDSHRPGKATAGLVAIYKRAGITDYDWKPIGPARDKIQWQYHTFDPPEKKPYEAGHRFREASLPKGMEQWFSPGFDAKAAGWKTGLAPFANLDGKLAPVGKCKATGNKTFCGCGEKPNTLWDKEVLLMRAEIKLPPMKEGYAYRLLVGGRSHYDAGTGSDVWFDGEYIGPGGKGSKIKGKGKKKKGGAKKSPAKSDKKGKGTSIAAGSGRNSHHPWGITITDAHRKHFEDGKVVLAAQAFWRWGWKQEHIKVYKTFWFEEMKLPEMPKVKEGEKQ